VARPAQAVAPSSVDLAFVLSGFSLAGGIVIDLSAGACGEGRKARPKSNQSADRSSGGRFRRSIFQPVNQRSCWQATEMEAP
jgi:hypothetical protein